MSIENLKQHLENKPELNYIENLVIVALRDNDFLKKYHNFNFSSRSDQFLNVLRQPSSFDLSGNESNYAIYLNALDRISNSYTTYLYDKEAKHAELEGKVSEIETRIASAMSDLKNIQELSDLISGERVLQIYAGEFEKRAGDYGRKAEEWMGKLYWSFGMLSVVVVSFVFSNLFDLTFLKDILPISEDMKHYGYFAFIFIKIVITIGLIQIVRFFYRNYNANKHLENQTMHKRDVLRALLGAYNTISSENKDARDELIKIGALTAFQNIESGYITTKEGAGSSDAGLYSIIGSILKSK